MTTLKIALAQSPTRAAWAEAQHGSVVKVRAQLIERHASASASATHATGRGGQQQTWTHALRYELLSDGVPQMVGSYHEIVEIASHLRGVSGAWELDWQPVWERAPMAAPQSPQSPRTAQEG